MLGQGHSMMWIRGSEISDNSAGFWAGVVLVGGGLKLTDASGHPESQSASPVSVSRIALAKYIPCLGFLLCVHPRDLRSTSSSFMSTRRSTVTSQTSDISSQFRRQSTAKSRLSSASDSESVRLDV